MHTWREILALYRLTQSAPEDMLQMWPVSRQVNRVGNDDDPKLIEAMQ